MLCIQFVNHFVAIAIIIFTQVFIALLCFLHFYYIYIWQCKYYQFLREDCQKRLSLTHLYPYPPFKNEVLESVLHCTRFFLKNIIKNVKPRNFYLKTLQRFIIPFRYKIFKKNVSFLYSSIKNYLFRSIFIYKYKNFYSVHLQREHKKNVSISYTLMCCIWI